MEISLPPCWHNSGTSSSITKLPKAAMSNAQGAAAVQPHHQHHAPRRTSMPSAIESSSTPRFRHGAAVSIHHQSALPRLSSTGSLQSTESKRRETGQNIVLETVIIPSRVVAQSMVSMSSSCPDLSTGRSGGSRRILRGSPTTASSASSSDMLTATGHHRTGKLVRCRIPLSLASTPRTARGKIVNGFVQGATPRQSQHQRQNNEKNNMRIEGAISSGRPESNYTHSPPDSHEGSTMIRRRPLTQEGRVSIGGSGGSVSPAATPSLPRRRRAGQYSLTAPNDLITQATPSAAAELPVDAAVSGGRPTCGSIRSFRVSTTARDAPTNPHQRDSVGSMPQTPPLTSRLPHGGQHPTQSLHAQTSISGRHSATRPASNFKRQMVKRLSSNSLQSNKSSSQVRDSAIASNYNRQDSSQAKSGSSEFTTMNNNGHSGEDEQEGNNIIDSNVGEMEPEAYQRCMRWVIDVESAKGDRSLDAIVLPPVQIFD